MCVDMRGLSGGAIMPNNAAQGFKPLFRCRVKDEIDRTGMRIEENEWFGHGY